MKRSVPGFALVVALAVAPPVAGQSLFSAAGLGLPIASLDARSRALGNPGIGLSGSAILPEDPAASAGLFAPTATFTAQPSWVSFQGLGDDGAGTFQGTRFPTVGVAYPVGGWGMATATFGSVLDQRYGVEQAGTVELQDGTAEVTDRFLSDGGLSVVRLGVSRVLGGGVAVGLSLGRYTGKVVRRFERTFLTAVGSSTVQQFQAGGFWSYSGTNVIAGASWDISRIVRVAGSVSWSSSLHAKPSDDTKGEAASYDLPLRIRLGGSGLLAPGMSLTAGISLEDWSGTTGDLHSGGTSGFIKDIGIGLELGQASLAGRSMPIRLGYRRRDLPFVMNGATPREHVYSGGFGLAFREVEGVTMAGVDLSLERGKRYDDVLSETFWRGTITLTVAGF